MSQHDYTDLDVEWVHADEVEPNDYNPNQMSRRKKRQLMKSILNSGWTQPVVVNEQTGAIIDGEQRWSLAAGQEDRLDTSDVEENDNLTPGGVAAGSIPVTRISKDEVEARISTVQHNRARGEHSLEGMSDLLAEMYEFDSLDYAQDQLMMNDEEVDRLLQENAAVEIETTDDMDEFSPTWEPKDESGSEEAAGDDEVSATSAAAGELSDGAEAADGTEGSPDGASPDAEGRGQATTEALARRVYVMSEPEADLVDDVLGTDVPAQVLVTLCEYARDQGWVPAGGDTDDAPEPAESGDSEAES